MRQSRMFRWWPVIAIVAVLSVAIEVAGLVYGWPIVRTAGYRVLVDQFAHAAPLAPTAAATAAQPAEWRLERSLSDGARVLIQSRDFMDVVKIQYGDDPRIHDLYRYVDYSSPVALRADGDILYVCWNETLVHTDTWLLAFDLAGRREIDRRRVDRRDLGRIDTARR